MTAAYPIAMIPVLAVLVLGVHATSKDAKPNTTTSGSGSGGASIPSGNVDLCSCYSVELLCAPYVNSANQLCYTYTVSSASAACEPVSFLSFTTGDLTGCALQATDISNAILDYAPKCRSIDASYNGGNLPDLAGIKVNINDDATQASGYEVFSLCFDASSVSGFQENGIIGFQAGNSQFGCTYSGILPDFCANPASTPTTTSNAVPAALTTSSTSSATTSTTSALPESSNVEPAPNTNTDPSTTSTTTVASNSVSSSTSTSTTSSAADPANLTPSDPTYPDPNPAPNTNTNTNTAPQTTASSSADTSTTTTSTGNAVPVQKDPATGVVAATTTATPVVPANPSTTAAAPQSSAISTTTTTTVTTTASVPIPEVSTSTTGVPPVPQPQTTAPVTPAPIHPEDRFFTTATPPQPAVTTTTTTTTAVPPVPEPETPATPAPIHPEDRFFTTATPPNTEPLVTPSPVTANPTMAPTFVTCQSVDELNVVFILDESGSVDEAEWKVITDFVDRIIQYDLSPNSFVSLYEYASLPNFERFLDWTQVESSPGDRSAFTAALSGNKYNVAGMTETWDAVNRVLDEYWNYRFSCTDGCEKRADIMFLITDGEPTGHSVCPDMIERMQQSEVDVVVIMVDPTGTLDTTKVSCLDINDKGRDVITLNNFDSNSFNAIEDRIRSKTCSGNYPAGLGNRPEAGTEWRYDGVVGLGPVPERNGGGKGGAADPDPVSVGAAVEVAGSEAGEDGKGAMGYLVWIIIGGITAIGIGAFAVRHYMRRQDAKRRVTVDGIDMIVSRGMELKETEVEDEEDEEEDMHGNDEADSGEGDHMEVRDKEGHEANTSNIV